MEGRCHDLDYQRGKDGVPVTRPDDPRDLGASSVEYALLIGAIAAVIVFTVFMLGGAVRSLFQDTCGRIDAHVTVAATC